QQELQQALSTLLRQPIEVVGAGRTDTGVHAKMMVAHFDLDPTQPPLKGEEFSLFKGELERILAYKLNKLLPADIAVQEVR
ncbi:hypothetical protein ELC62_30630, partial [Klebsiella pneumoniae]|nr:hypothetical protein [Klebsiella pneumoniae]